MRTLGRRANQKLTYKFSYISRNILILLNSDQTRTTHQSKSFECGWNESTSEILSLLQIYEVKRFKVSVSKCTTTQHLCFKPLAAFFLCRQVHCVLVKESSLMPLFGYCLILRETSIKRLDIFIFSIAWLCYPLLIYSGIKFPWHQETCYPSNNCHRILFQK